MTPPTSVATAESGIAEPAPEDAQMLEHAYDGIREYDNPLPGWWRAIFWGTIVFAVVYWVWFDLAGWGKTPDEAYRASLAGYESRREVREAADARDVSEEMLARNAADPNVAAHGAAIFTSRCASCHAEDGRGLIGPNLTDGFQLHGSARMDLFKTVRGGIAGTAMLAWGEQMPSTDVVAVTAFVITLRGKDVAGKEPQGQPVEPFR